MNDRTASTTGGGHFRSHRAQVLGRAWSLFAIIGFGTLAVPFIHPCHAETYRANPSGYLAALKRLQPGDRLLLEPGEYRDGLPLHRLNGAAGRPIIISGPAAGNPAIFLGHPGINTVSIVNSSYVTVRNMILDGRGLIVDGVKAEGTSEWAHHITLEKLRIVNHNYDQQIVGISAQCPSWNWVIRGNTIVGAGTGMYLGRSNGRAPFFAGLIEHNVIVDTIGYNIEIKQQDERPKIEGMPEDRNLTVIRHNVFVKSANASMGRMARPNLLVGHWPPSGPGAEDSYAIYGNFFYQNPSEALFQGEGNIAFYSNVLVNTYGDAINIQRHKGMPRRVDVFHNTVLATGTGIHVSGGDPNYTQRLTANAVFAKTPIVGGEQHANRTGTLSAAVDQLIDPTAPLGRLNLAPKSGRLGISSIDIPSKAGLPDADRDFDGRVYSQQFAGAYAGHGAVWHLRIGPKP